MARIPLVAVASAAFATSIAGSVHADELSGARNAITEVSDVIEARFDRGFLRFNVRRTLHNPGPRHDQATLRIEMPDGSVATGLRTLGTLDGRPHWFDADLMEAEAAAARYQELTGIGGYYPKDPALLSWRSQTELALQVFPVAPGIDKTVEYSLIVPADYRAGRYRYALAPLGLEGARARVHVTPARATDRVALDDSPAAGVAQFLANEQHEIQLVAGDPPPFGGELSTTEVGSHRALTHYSFELAPKISVVPRGAWIVVLIDGSYSLDAEDRRAEARAARAYLKSFSDAHVVVASFDRSVHPLGGFLAVERASAALERLDLEGHNGSNTDSALAFADAALASAPKGAERRVLLLTDSLVRESLTAQDLSDRISQSGAVLHIGVISAGGNSLTRDDEHDWSSVARSTGGLVWNAQIGDDVSGVEIEQTVQSWARPTSLDHVVLMGRGVEDRAEQEPLREGERLTDVFAADTPTSEITVRGELWSRPFETKLRADPAAARRWAALVFGSAVFDQFDEKEQMALARLGGAVSPVTSYLAVEPGVRPSTEGFEHTAFGIGEGSGSGSGYGSGHGRLGGGSKFDPQKYLDDLVQRTVRECDPRADTAQADFELTKSEIVAIDASTVEIPSADDALTEKAVRCFREALWSVELPWQFSEAHSSWHAGTTRRSG